MTSFADGKAATSLENKRFLRDVESKLEDSQPVVCQMLICAIQTLVRRKLSLTGQQVLTRDEMLRVRRETDTFTRTFQQFKELTCDSAVVERNRGIENEVVRHGNGMSVHTLDV